MRNRWLVIPLIICSGYLALGRVASVRSYGGLPLQDLAIAERSLRIEIAKSDAKIDSTPADKQRLGRLQWQLNKVLAELFARRYYLDSVAYGVLIVCLLMLVANRLQRRERRVLLNKNKDALIRDMSVAEEPPREEYVDDWTFEHRIQDGFKLREEAIRWIKSDPVLNCGYCGSRMRSTFVGNRESIQMVVFYKQVPGGAKDMRVVLGSYWFAKAASDLLCSSCGRVEKR